MLDDPYMDSKGTTSLRGEDEYSGYCNESTTTRSVENLVKEATYSRESNNIVFNLPWSLSKKTSTKNSTYPKALIEKSPKRIKGVLGSNRSGNSSNHKTLSRLGRDTRVLIVKAAKELFESTKYDKVTVQKIGDRAKLNKASVYHHFKTKYGVYRAVQKYIKTGEIL